MRTGAQVYQGLAGLLLVSDAEEDALGLPTCNGDLLCVLQDRRVNAQNQFEYAAGGMGMAAMMQTMNGWVGDTVLVNGRSRPATDVDRRTYRVRILNGSNARIYKLAWSDGTPLTIIGGDGGLLERARTVRALTLAPAQRADMLLDLSSHVAGSIVEMRSLAYSAEAVGRARMMADTSPLPQGAAITLMTLTVSGSIGTRIQLPERLSAPMPLWAVKANAPVRRVALQFRQMNWLMNGRTFEMDTVAADETVAAGATQVWELVNETHPMGMAMAHPIHLHGRQVRILSRSGAETSPLNEGFSDGAPTDMVLVLPGHFPDSPWVLITLTCAWTGILLVRLGLGNNGLQRDIERVRIETGTNDVEYAPHLASRRVSAGPQRYSSSWTLFGLPLFAFATGGLDVGSYWTRGARGWIAIGDVAISPFLAIGGLAVAPIAIGGATVGVLSLSIAGVAFVMLAFGSIAVGWWAIGAVAVGWKAAAGAAAVARDYAVGSMARAAEANTIVAVEWFKAQ